MTNRAPAISLEGRLKECKNVLTLGVRPNFDDYTSTEKSLIKESTKIFYPSSFYADLFDAAGKDTFPSYHTYKCVQDKIKQTALFNLLEIPHPKTKTFYGKRTYHEITACFSYPFIGKIPRGSARGKGVYLITDPTSLDAYLAETKVAYIQEYIPIDRDIRVVVIGQEAVLAYWRLGASGDFRTNLSQGGRISLNSVPQAAVDFALFSAKKCGWDDVGMDIMYHEDRFYVIEGNMKYGKAGFDAAGIDYIQMMEKMIENGAI